MPTQLYTNRNITFICGRNFTWNGTEYKLGDEWDQELSVGRLDSMVRSRYLYPVVDSTDEKPRHWHHHVHVREVLEKKLGITRDLEQSSIATRGPQIGIEHSVADYESHTPWEETSDNGQALHDKAVLAYETERVLKEENEENPEPEDETESPLMRTDEESVEERTEETEPVTNADGDVVLDSTPEDEDERALVEEDLYDPAEHSVDEVMEYLTSDISEDEYNRVVAAERVGKQRKGIMNNA